jgi:limonene 1,2-monooxygenase
MEFGIFSNGFRPHTSAAQTYDEDIQEIVLADQLGFRDAYISEHHGEPPYINAVDTIPDPELLMCKAAALTRNIRMGSAVKLIHLHHPLDVAIKSAITSHMLNGRYIFGFGSGFPSPLFAQERGLSFEDRHERLRESLDFIRKCWTEDEIFDWEDKHWHGKGIVALPKPSGPLQMATATDSDDMLAMAGANGWTLLTAFIEPAAFVRAKAEKYRAAALAAGRKAPLRNLVASRIVYIANSRKEAIEQMRPAVTYEVGVQAQRGFLTMMKRVYGLDIPDGPQAIDALVEADLYTLGDPDQVTEQILRYYDQTGGFGTFLIVTGKSWSTRENRIRSMRLFAEQVVPRLRHLDPEA